MWKQSSSVELRTCIFMHSKAQTSRPITDENTFLVEGKVDELFIFLFLSNVETQEAVALGCEPEMRISLCH